MTQAMVKADNQMLQAMPAELSRQQMDLLRKTVAAGTNETEFSLFVEVCRSKGLNPFAKQIYAIKRGGGMTIQTGIDGYRLIAQRSGRFEGRLGPWWCGPDGQWVDVWLADAAPAAARVGVLMKGVSEPTFAVATFKEYCQKKDGKPTGLWATMPANMLAKCAEAQALRAAFPEELSGIYTNEEMLQADSEPVDRSEAPRGRAAAREAMRDGSMGRAAKETAQTQAKAPNPEPWMTDLREQVAAWEQPWNKMAEIFGAPITVRGMRKWAEGREDPFADAMEWLRSEMAAAESEDGMVIEGTATEVVDEPGEPALELPFE